MAEMPKRIAVTQARGRWSLEVDGQEFPWYITEDGINVNVSTDGIPSVTLTLFADTVTVIHSLNELPEAFERRMREADATFGDVDG